MYQLWEDYKESKGRTFVSWLALWMTLLELGGLVPWGLGLNFECLSRDDDQSNPF